MTSIIKVDTIQNKAGSTSLAANKLPDMLSGSAKAWVNYSGLSSTVTDSFNVSSLTDHAAGQHSTNFSNNMGNANYSLPAQCSYDIAGSTPTNYTALTVKQASGQSTTSACRVNTAYATTAGGGLRDMEIVCLSIHGDLA